MPPVADGPPHVRRWPEPPDGRGDAPGAPVRWWAAPGGLWSAGRTGYLKRCSSADSEISIHLSADSESFHKQILVYSKMAWRARCNVRTLQPIYICPPTPGGIVVSDRDLSVNVT